MISRGYFCFFLTLFLLRGRLGNSCHKEIMPRFYCEHCDIFLTRDSKQNRKAHAVGWRHKSAVREHYTAVYQQETQAKVDAIVRHYETQLLSSEPLIVPLGPHGHPGLVPPEGYTVAPDACYQEPITQDMVDHGEYRLQSSILQPESIQKEGFPP